ncbi:MAG: hypothetical protein AAFO69_01150 [Bacteroidota bacterium]
MTLKSVVTYLLSFLAYVLIQAALLNQLVIANSIFCFFYVGFILLLPLGSSRMLQLILGFLSGFVVDVFGDSIGVHMIACTFIMFVRPLWLQIVLGDIKEMTGFINISGVTIFRLFVFLGPLLLIHHFLIFYLDAIGTDFSFSIILKTLLSAIFTFIVLLIIQLFITNLSKRK